MDKYREEIIALLKTGSKQVYIAKKYHTSQPNLYNWIRKHDLVPIPVIPPCEYAASRHPSTGDSATLSERSDAD